MQVGNWDTIDVGLADVGDVLRVGGRDFMVASSHDRGGTAYVTINSDDGTYINLSREAWNTLGGEAFRERNPLPEELGSVIKCRGKYFVRVCQDSSVWFEWRNSEDPNDVMSSSSLRYNGKYEVLHRGWEGGC